MKHFEIKFFIVAGFSLLLCGCTPYIRSIYPQHGWIYPQGAVTYTKAECPYGAAQSILYTLLMYPTVSGPIITLAHYTRYNATEFTHPIPGGLPATHQYQAHYYAYWGDGYDGIDRSIFRVEPGACCSPVSTFEIPEVAYPEVSNEVIGDPEVELGARWDLESREYTDLATSTVYTMDFQFFKDRLLAMDINLLLAYRNAYTNSQVYTGGSMLGLSSEEINSLIDLADSRLSLQKKPVNDTPSLDGGFSLKFNYPNPFNPETNISYTIARPGLVMITILSLDGKSIRVLLDRYQTNGTYQIVWDGRNDKRENVASGVYICRMDFNGTSRAIKMLLAR